MGLFDKLKDVTGLGLNAEQQYQRAYEKGVFLQPPNYEAAAKHFSSAEEKFEKDGKNEMAKRAHANSLLYSMIHTKSTENVNSLISFLEQIPEIEFFGSQTEMVPTEKMITEFRALQNELSAEKAENITEKINGYKKAAEIIMKLANESLFYLEKLNVGGPINSAMMRGLYYLAKADYVNAFSIVYQSPEQAQNYLQKAAVGFRQAQSKDWADKTDCHIENIKVKRHCWICGREMQGLGFFYNHYPANTKKYHKEMVEGAKQDIGMLEKENSITLCTVCGSAVETQADIYATKRMRELREWVEPILNSHAEMINRLDSRLSHVESCAHRHTS